MDNRKKPVYVSLIIPTKDREEDLKELLGDLANQDDQFFELIIVDASKKSKKDLIKDWLNQFESVFDFYYLKSKPNLSYQRNVGIDHSIGDIVGFLDDDIRLKEDFISNLKEVAANHPEKDGFSGLDKNSRSSFLRRLFSKLFLINGFGWSNYQGVSISGTSRMMRENRKIEDAGYLPGGFSFYRKEIFNKYLFNEFLAHPPCFDDLDFGYRSSKDFDYILSPKLSFFHKSSEISRANIHIREYRNIFYYLYLVRTCFYQFWRLPFVIWTILGYFLLNLLLSLRYVNLKIALFFIKGLVAGLKIDLREINNGKVENINGLSR